MVKKELQALKPIILRILSYTIPWNEMYIINLMTTKIALTRYASLSD